MHQGTRLAAVLAGLFLLAPARAGGPPNPLRFVHDKADLLVEVPDPGRLVEAVTRLDLRHKLEPFTAFQEFLDSTPRRRGLQLLAYVEKQLGASWPVLLDRLAGGGAVVALKFGPNPVPVLLVVQGKDEKLMARFFPLALDVLDGELTRQEGKAKLQREQYHGLPVAHAGKEVWLGLAGSALLVANSDKALYGGLDRHLGREKASLADNKLVAEARQMLPPGPLVRAWVSLDAAHKSAAAKEIYKVPRDDAGQTVLFGPYLDLVGRSPYTCAGLYGDDKGVLLTARLPRGLEGMGEDRALHLPPPGKPGSRPLLEPKGVLYSSSDYLDFARIWTDRAKLFPAEQVKKLEKFDETSGTFLAGNRMSKLLTKLAPYYRFVAAHQSRTTYKKTPEVGLPSFALAAEMREPEALAKSLEAVLRGAALLASFQVKLKLVEEKHAGCALVGWRFPEDAPFKNDTANFRFNFSPCFVRVGDQFVLCSTLEMGREMIDLLQAEAKGKDKGEACPDHSRIYAAGAAEVLEVFRDRLLVQTVLARAVSPDEAREQVRALVELVRGLGVLETSSNFEAKQFRYDVRLRTGK
jgi:hypothetical protein